MTAAILLPILLAQPTIEVTGIAASSGGLLVSTSRRSLSNGPHFSLFELNPGSGRVTRSVSSTVAEELAAVADGRFFVVGRTSFAWGKTGELAEVIRFQRQIRAQSPAVRVRSNTALVVSPYQGVELFVLHDPGHSTSFAAELAEWSAQDVVAVVDRTDISKRSGRGRPLWRRTPVRGQRIFSMAASVGSIAFATKDRFGVLESETGTSRWVMKNPRFRDNTRVHAVDAELLFISQSRLPVLPPVLSALAVSDGKERWEASTGLVRELFLCPETVLVHSTTRGSDVLQSLTRRTGEQRWMKKLKPMAKVARACETDISFVATEGHILALARNGARMWSTPHINLMRNKSVQR